MERHNSHAVPAGPIQAECLAGEEAVNIRKNRWLQAYLMIASRTMFWNWLRNMTRSPSPTWTM